MTGNLLTFISPAISAKGIHMCFCKGTWYIGCCVAYHLSIDPTLYREAWHLVTFLSHLYFFHSKFITNYLNIIMNWNFRNQFMISWDSLQIDQNRLGFTTKYPHALPRIIPSLFILDLTGCRKLQIRLSFLSYVLSEFSFHILCTASFKKRCMCNILFS